MILIQYIMSKIDFNLTKNAFFQKLLTLALNKISYIPLSQLTVLANYVTDEYISKYTFLQYSSNFHIEISDTELIKHIKKHSKKILANDYDCSGYLNINSSYIHLNKFSRVMYDLYILATTIKLSSIII
jgi:hypothetical protein